MADVFKSIKDIPEIQKPRPIHSGRYGGPYGISQVLFGGNPHNVVRNKGYNSEFDEDDLVLDDTKGNLKQVGSRDVYLQNPVIFSDDIKKGFYDLGYNDDDINNQFVYHKTDMADPDYPRAITDDEVLQYMKSHLDDKGILPKRR